MQTVSSNDIPLLVIGSDFRLASVVLREQLVSTAETRKPLFESIRKIDPEAGFVSLETCNRTEWIISTTQPQWLGDILRAHMIHIWQQAFPQCSNFPEPYMYTGMDAARHVLQVVAGLKSLAAGEAQIAGQFQKALELSRVEQSASIILNGLGSVAGRIAKQGYRIGFRSDHRQGIHGMAGEYLRRYFDGETKGKRVLVVGMGMIGRRTAEYLDQHLGCDVTAVNRTVKPAQQGQWQPLADLRQLSADADAIVAATGAHQPVITEDNIIAPKGKDALLVLDIGIPRQVGKDVEAVESVAYRDLDDLMDIRIDPDQARFATEMKELVETELERFKRFCHERDMVPFLDKTRRGREEIIHQLIPEIVRTRLHHLNDSDQRLVQEVVSDLVREYSNDIFANIHLALDEYWSSKNHD